MTPHPESRAAQAIQSYIYFFNDWFVLASKPDGKKGQAITTFKITLLGYWMLGGGLIAILASRFRGNLGAWYLVAVGYLFGVFLVGSANPRFFCPAWAPLILVLAVPLDWAAALLTRRTARKEEASRNRAADRVR